MSEQAGEPGQEEQAIPGHWLSACHPHHLPTHPQSATTPTSPAPCLFLYPVCGEVERSSPFSLGSSIPPGGEGCPAHATFFSFSLHRVRCYLPVAHAQTLYAAGNTALLLAATYACAAHSCCLAAAAIAAAATPASQPFRLPVYLCLAPPATTTFYLTCTTLLPPPPCLPHMPLLPPTYIHPHQVCPSAVRTGRNTVHRAARTLGSRRQAACHTGPGPHYTPPTISRGRRRAWAGRARTAINQRHLPLPTRRRGGRRHQSLPHILSCLGLDDMGMAWHCGRRHGAEPEGRQHKNTRTRYAGANIAAACCTRRRAHEQHSCQHSSLLARYAFTVLHTRAACAAPPRRCALPRYQSRRTGGILSITSHAGCLVPPRCERRAFAAVHLYRDAHIYDRYAPLHAADSPLPAFAMCRGVHCTYITRACLAIRTTADRYRFHCLTRTVRRTPSLPPPTSPISSTARARTHYTYRRAYRRTRAPHRATTLYKRRPLYCLLLLRAYYHWVALHNHRLYPAARTRFWFTAALPVVACALRV